MSQATIIKQLCVLLCVRAGEDPEAKLPGRMAELMTDPGMFVLAEFPKKQWTKYEPVVYEMVQNLALWFEHQMFSERGGSEYAKALELVTTMLRKLHNDQFLEN